MARKSKVSYNEHDVNQVRRIFNVRRKNKVKKRVKVAIVVFCFVIVGLYLYSDLSKVKTITVEGNSVVKTKQILDVIAIDNNDFHFLVNTKKIKNSIKELPLIKKVSVKKTFFGDIKIDIEEADKIAYGIINKKIYLIDELGKVSYTDDKEVINDLKFTPQFVGFKSLDFLKTFAKEYLKIPDLVKNQTSDIIYEPEKSDTTRLKFIMINGKIMYLRVEDMAQQLNSIDYEAMMTEYKDRCVFSFEGKHIYTQECD